MERARTKPGRVEAKADSLVWLPGWSDMWGWQFASLNKEKTLVCGLDAGEHVQINQLI